MKVTVPFQTFLTFWICYLKIHMYWNFSLKLPSFKPYFPTMQALARNNEEGDGSAYAFFPSQFLQSPFLRCSHPKWTKTLDELITSFYKYMLFLGDSSTTFYVIIWKKLIYFTPLLLKNRTHIWLISGRKIPDLKYVSDNFFNKFSTSSFIESSRHVAYYI